MNKPFLLIAGSHYYPSAYTDDWVGCYETYEEAKAQVELVQRHTYFKAGKNKGEVKSTQEAYLVHREDYDREVDWFEIVDLNDWTNR